MRSDWILAASVGLLLLAFPPQAPAEPGTAPIGTVPSVSQMPPQPQRLALVYRGPGACDACAEALGAVARRAGLAVRYVSPGEITPALLREATVWIQGGGDDATEMRVVLSDDEVAALRGWVAQGGRYWGVCAGAYLAGDTVSDDGAVEGLRLIPGDAERYAPTPEPRVEQVLWEGEERWMYLQEAPKFELHPGAHVDVLARYRDGSLAAFVAPYGEGRVAVTGPHPEANKRWLALDGLPAEPGVGNGEAALQMLLSLISSGG
jgi:glutamine amidotransferase PdxT